MRRIQTGKKMYCMLHVPASFVFSVLSDICLVAYGVIMYDFIIIGYAGVNIFVILFVMLKFSHDHHAL